MPDTPDPTVLGAAEFEVLIRALTSAALDSPDDAGVDRAMRYRAHLKTVRDRWLSGDASPVRAAKKAAA